jgi:hypothetical protein
VLQNLKEELPVSKGECRRFIQHFTSIGVKWCESEKYQFEISKTFALSKNFDENMEVNGARRNIGRKIRLFSKGFLEFKRQRYDPMKNTSNCDVTERRIKFIFFRTEGN